MRVPPQERTTAIYSGDTAPDPNEDKLIKELVSTFRVSRSWSTRGENHLRICGALDELWKAG